VLALLASSAAASTPPTPLTLVICAPGYPGSTAEAQPSMDTLAAAVSRAAGWPVGTVKAEYQETEAGGIARFKGKAPTLALVPLPFYLEHASELKLTPRVQAVLKDAHDTEVWTLVAKKGRVTGPGSLAGWKIASLAAYAPEFVKNVALGGWGALPADVELVETGQVLSALRKAASGENVAVLLDGTQSASLSSLPFAADLETVAKSPALPTSVLGTIGPALGPIDAKRLTTGLLKMADTPDGAAALDAVRLARFVPLDDKALAQARRSYGQRVQTAAK